MNISLIISDSHVYVKQTIDKVFGGFSDVIKYDYTNSSLDEILYEFSSVNLFSDNKFIVIEKADEIFSKSFESEDLMEYFHNPSDLTKVVFVVSKVDKTSEFYKYVLKNYQVFDSNEKKFSNNILAVKNYVKDHKSHISDKALEYIKEATLNNYDLMVNEIDKLLILGKDNVSDELVYNLVPLTPDGNTNIFIDALLAMNDQEVLKCINNFDILNIDLTKMVALIAWNVRVVYLIKINRKNKSSLDKVLKNYKIPDFKYNKYVTMGNIRSEEEFENIIIGLSDIDEKIKTFKITKESIGYHLLNLFCL